MIVTGGGPDIDDSSQTFSDRIWVDSETQKFYCQLPELQAFLPTSFINKNNSVAPPDVVTEDVLDSDIPAETEECEEDGKYYI